MTPIPAFLAVLLLAGAVLMWEARTGRLTPSSLRTGIGRGGLFFAAAVFGGALFMRSLDASPLLAATLAPVTGLSLFRLVSLTRLRWRSGLAVLALALALFGGLSASLRALPGPLDQRTIVEQIFHSDRGPQAVSINPAARRSVRT